MRAWLHEVSRALGSEACSSRTLSGGSINEALLLRLKDNREVFVKSHASADPRMFHCEARGLSWLSEVAVLRTPRVLAVSDENSTRGFLVLEYLEEGRRGRNFDAELGRGLAALHKSGADQFGFEEDNFLATLPQSNRPRESWAGFYVEERLSPQLALCIEAGFAPQHWQRSFDRLFARMHDLAGPVEPAARLHGDLWSGNVHCDSQGHPVLIDPAVYGGHREMDLAMLQLFGAPGPAFFSAYDEVYPRAAGHQDRLALYQLYPLLAHVNLFGESYVASVENALRSIG